MSNATKRIILRWIHLIAVIPVLGYVYGKPAEVEQYIGAPRLIFVPLLMLTGYWMYAGVIFAIVSVAVWLAAIHFTGFGWALLSQMVLLLGRAIWRAVGSRNKKQAN
jgi:hypothetical protein